MSEFETPMMLQYKKIKEQYSDCLLFFRLGDFYELFLEDAEIGAKVLNITLTSRDRGKDGRIPMAGVPYHAADTYLAKLVEAGYKVAICEQISEPSGGVLVDREVVRIVTPGTILSDSTLMHCRNNYLVSISKAANAIAFAFSDISTGEFVFSEISYIKENLADIVSQEIGRFQPSECILSNDLYNDPVFLKYLTNNPDPNIYPFHNWDLYAADYKTSKKYIQDHFKISNLHAFSLEGKEAACQAVAALLAYLKHTQKNHVNHIKKIGQYKALKSVEIDKSTLTNLELFSTLRDNSKSGTLYNTLDRTKTAMGARLLRKWLMQPSSDLAEINYRLEIVDYLKKQRDLRKNIVSDLNNIMDIERLFSKLSVGLGNARDLVNLKNSLVTVLSLKGKLADPIFSKFNNSLSVDLKNAIAPVDKYITDDPPVDLKEGGLIKTGVSSKIDQLRTRVYHSKEWISRLEKDERTRSGITSLKVKYNKVFGYYIEISNSNLEYVPENYIRKQTLVNAERYITPELKEQEELVLSASEELKNLEYDLFLEVVQEVLKCIDTVQNSAEATAILDCLVTFADTAERNNYVRPNMTTDGVIDIKNGRHPVIELLIENQQFVPNDVCLDNSENQLLLITGPNMAGKSVYIRQVAVLVLMAHIGSFIPATEASISLVDRIFVRSGASDVISKGLSTFMVEMIEAAYILNHATKDSLIVMDEIGRGTSTYDGISIASAIAEYLVTGYSSGGPKTLFATHYHELQNLESQLTGVKNFQVIVKHENGTPVFLHKVVTGGASHSFGVAVAKMAGVPDQIISRAKILLRSYENGDAELPSIIYDNAAIENSPITEKLKEIDPQKITPIEALNILVDLKKLTE